MSREWNWQNKIVLKSTVVQSIHALMHFHISKLRYIWLRHCISYHLRLSISIFSNLIYEMLNNKLNIQENIFVIMNCLIESIGTFYSLVSKKTKTIFPLWAHQLIWYWCIDSFTYVKTYFYIRFIDTGEISNGKIF